MSPEKVAVNIQFRYNLVAIVPGTGYLGSFSKSQTPNDTTTSVAEKIFIFVRRVTRILPCIDKTLHHTLVQKPHE